MQKKYDPKSGKKKIAKNEDASGPRYRLFVQLRPTFAERCLRSKANFHPLLAKFVIHTSEYHQPPPLSTYKVSLLEIRRLADAFSRSLRKSAFPRPRSNFPPLYIYVWYLSCAPGLCGGYRTTMGAFVLSRLVDFIGACDRIASRCVRGVA